MEWLPAPAISGMRTTVGASDAVRLGLVGAGRWGKRYIETIAGVESATLVHLGSRNPLSAGLVPAGCRVSADWRRVIADTRVDGIIVATPPATHLEITSAAIGAGIAVLVEKPMTMSPAEAEALASMAEAAGVLVMVDHTHLFSGAFRELLRQSEQLGPVLGLRSAGGNFGPFREDTPVLWDWAPHDVAMALAIFDEEPVEIVARRAISRVVEGIVGEAIDISLDFARGRRAEIRVSNIDSEKRRWLEARFAGATLVYDDLAIDKLRIHEEGVSPRAIPFAEVPPLTAAVEEFARAITSGRLSDPSLELGRRVVQILSVCQTSLDHQ